MRGWRAVTAVIAAVLTLGGAPEARADAAAIWAQSGDDDAISWSGAKGEVRGIVHSNGGIKVKGARNSFLGGTNWVTKFTNSHPNGNKANVFDPLPMQVTAGAFPRPYDLADFMPGGQAALAAGDAYVDLTAACAIGGSDDDDDDHDDDGDHDEDDDHDDHRYCKNGRHHHRSDHSSSGGYGDDDDDDDDEDDDDEDDDGSSGGGDSVSLSFSNESLSGRLYWAPCDISVAAKNANGEITVVSSGKVHLQARKDSNLLAFANGILALSASSGHKAIHINGNKSTLRGDIIAGQGQVHLAGSRQTLSCGIYAERVKISGSQLTITGEDCGTVDVNAPPMAGDDAVDTLEDTAVAIDVLANDSDADGSLVPSSVAIQTGPANGSTNVDGATGVVTYTPNQNFAGSDSFTYTVADDDGAVSQPATVTVAVADQNDAPVALDDAASTPEDSPIQIQVTGNDTDIDGSVDPSTVLILIAPLNGTTEVDPDTGIVTYTPDPDFFGDDSFRYTVADNDGAVSSAANVIVTVDPVNDAPVVQSDSVAATEDQPEVLDILANDFDVDNVLTTANIIVGVQPSNGIITTDAAANTITYTPNANFNGADSFEYSLTDDSGASSIGSSLVSITVAAVNDAPVADAVSVQAVEDVAADVLLAGSDVDGDAISFVIVDQPGSGALSGSAPNLTYVGSPDFFGTDQFTYEVTDGTLTSPISQVTITVAAVNDLPVAMNQAISVDEDASVDFILDVADVEADVLTFQFVDLPDNGNLTGSGPDLQYTPDADFNGTDAFTYVANDGVGDSAPATVTITVNNANDVPVADGQALSVDEDTSIAVTLTGTDADGDALTFTVQGTGPSNGTLSGTAPNLTYTPNANFNGGDSFTFTINDGTVDSSPATVSITVNGVNDAPVADDQGATTDEDTPLGITLSGSDLDGDPITFAVESQPTNGTLSGTAPDLTYTPNANFNGGDSFTFTVNDGTVDSSPATVSITVNGANDAPTADDQGVSTDEDTPVGITLTGSDLDSDPITYAVETQPTNGALSGTAPDLTYTPNANFNDGDSFTFTVNDGTVDSSPATVSITVNSVNDAPVADDQGATTDEDTPVGITLTGSDLDGDSLTFAVVQQPASGLLSGTAPDLTYTPNANFNGADSFTFVANDGTVDSSPATVSITVDGANDAPVADDQGATTDEDTPVGITLTGSDLDGDSLTFAVVQQPASGILSGTAPDLTYTPNANFNGADSFTFVANDGTVDSSPATVSITVDGANDAPTADDQGVSTDEDTPVGITLTGSDLDGDPITYTVVTQPTNGTLSGTAPDLTYTPNANFNGGDSFTFTVNDGTVDSSPATVSITVTPVNDLPLADDLSIDAVAGVGVAVPLAGSDDDGDSLTFAIVTPPSNGALSGPLDNLVYTANTGFAGTDSLTYTASDGNATSLPATVTFNVVDDNAAPIIESTPVTSANVGTAYAYQVVATDTDGDTLSYFLSEAPAGMSITSGGLVEWAAPVLGSYPVTVQVSDGNAGLAEQSYTLDVNANVAPEFVQVPALNAAQGELYRSIGQAVDPDGDPVTIVLTSGPAGAELNELGDGQFELVWIAAGNIGDTTPFTILATDPSGADATLNLSITTTGPTVNRSHLGTDFWLTYGPNFRNYGFGLSEMPLDDPGRQLQVEIGAPEGAMGLVEITGLSFAVDVNIPVGGTQRVDIPIAAMRDTACCAGNVGNAVGVSIGVHVTTDNPVTVAGINWAFATTDAWLALPTSTLGTQYTITGYVDVLFGPPNTDEIFWAVLAVEDGTTFTVTPLREIPLRVNPSSVQPVTRTLNRGELWVGSTRYAKSAEVVADRPVAAFGGSTCADVPTGIGTCDHLWQQFVPDNTLASEYLAAPLAERAGSLYRVIATEDDTLVFLNGAYRARLDRGQNLETALPGSVAIRGSKPIVAVQYATGYEFDEGTVVGTEPDPFMLNLAPVDTFLSSYTVIVPSGDGVFRDQPDDIVRPPIDRHYLAIVIPASAANSLVVDGVPVDTAGFEAVPESDHLAGNIPITPGAHQLSADEQFGVTVYGWGVFESYGFYAGLVFPDGTATLNLDVTGPTGPLVAGSQQACFDLVTTDTGGARVPRARYALTVDGNFPLSNVGFTDEIGEAQYCYTQPGPTVDTVTIVVNGDSEILNITWLPDTDPATNGAPRIISLPEVVLYEQTFAYPLLAADPDGDVVTWNIVDAPAGAAISSDTLFWTPPIPADRQPTTHEIEVQVDDSNGGTDNQRFVLKVYYPAIFTEPLPQTRQFQLFSGFYERSMNHLGGDPNLLVAEMIEGEGTISFGGFGGDPRYYLNGRAQLIALDQYEFSDSHNRTCRAPSPTLGQFALRSVWQEPTSETIDAAVAGPVVDTNGDGSVNDTDDIYAAFAERDSVALYNITTREEDWRVPVGSHTFGAYAAMANVDTDIETELLFVHSIAGDNTRRLTAYNADGSVAWRSSHAPIAGDYSSGNRMPILPVDLDFDGVTEILYGPYVYDNNGNVLWQFDNTAIGQRSSQGVPLAIDLDSDGRREVLFQDEVRDADGNVLWSLPYATDVRRPQVYYAAGDLTADPGLEVVASIATPDGVFHEAFTATGARLWSNPIEGIGHGLPVVLDIDRDGNAEVFLAAEKTIVNRDGEITSADAGVGSNVIPSLMDFDRDGVPELFQYDNSWRFDVNDIYSRQRWLNSSFRNQTNGFGRSQLWQDALWIDPDHDGETELFVAGTFGKGLFESAANPWPLTSRRYSQVIDFDQPTIGFDTEFGTPAGEGIADAWIGRIQLQQITEQDFGFEVQVKNKGLKAINEPITVEFYRGRISDNELLGTTTLDRLDVNEVRTASIPVQYEDRAPVMSARLVLDPASVQCDDLNDAVEGEQHTIELSDGDTPYRTARFTYLHQQYYVAGDVGFGAAPVNTTITLGETYTFDADAGVSGLSNIGNGVWFGLSSGSLAAGMRVNSATGEITWTPTFARLGTTQFELEAFSIDDSALSRFSITVEPRANDVPVITTTPPTTLLLLGQSFSYDVDATDADGDSLSYELQVSPAGMTIDSATGLVDWTPDPSQIGLHPVTIAVDDSFGGVATQNFSLQVGSSTNTGPTITSVPPFTAKATFEYQYQVTVDDPDGDFITYSVETGPADMVIDGNGLLSWTPDASGVENIVVRASDGQAFADQGWTLTISDAAIPLMAAISANPAVADLGSSVELTIGYSGAAGSVSLSLTVDGNVVPVDSSGIVSVPADTVGLHTATAIVTDPYASDSATVNFTVIDPNSTSTPPIVNLISPDFEEEVTAPRDAIGTVSDPDDDLLSWFLALQYRGAGPTEFTTLASGTGPIIDDVLGQIDPTMLLNGLYSVILQATDAAGNVSQDVRVIRVTGDLKVGNFSITFEDFSAPVAGIPVTVLRTYDTRQRVEDLDFGYGWSIDYQNVRLQESRDIGFSWTLIEEDFGLFSQFCVRPNGDPTVTVRLPDGEVETFVARASPECTQIVPTVDVNIVFEPRDFTSTTLEQTDFGTVRIVNGNIVDLGEPGTPIDATNYRLTTEEGIVYELDQSFGVRRVTDTHGNTLTYSDSGIVHSQGFALTFNRNADGRIESIVAPDGTRMAYGYDANGDLETFTDQVDNVTRFTYTNATDHYLEDIIDPRGIRVSRSIYDDDGRLIEIIDADGNRIEYTHDIAGRTETVRDRRMNPTVYVYDDDGNVLIETNPLGETITRTFDGDRNVLTETNDLGERMTWTYDERANILAETNDLNQTTINTYDDRNLLETVTDPQGLPVMTNVYDTRNTNMLTMTDANEEVMTFFWDSAIGTCSTGASRGVLDAENNRTTIQPQCVGPFAELPAWEEDARGVRTTFAYDALGRVERETTTRIDEFGAVQDLETLYEYDDKGRLEQVTDPEGNVTITEWNVFDKEAATIDPNLNRTEYEYDDRGNRRLVRYADLTTETMDYDPVGNKISQTDRLGRTTRMVYDAANRLRETIYPDDTPGNDLDNPRTVNEYDRAGRLSASIDERGNRTEYEYDRAGRQELIRNALDQETRFEYNTRGLRTAMIDALNRRTEYVYDDVGRLVTTIFPDDTPGDVTDNLRMQTDFDRIGRNVAETDLAGLTTRFEYDPVGNLEAVIDALDQRTEYGYDEQSNKITQTDAERRVTRWGYDNAGRVTSRSLPETQRETFTYDDAGNRIGHVDFNGESHSFDYDELNRQISQTYADSIVVTMTYTDTGQAETVTDDRGTTSFEYDERDRLTRITYPTGKAIDYGYDDAGNRTSLDTVNQSLSYAFDVLNRLETVTDQAGTTTYDYDAVGNPASIDYANGTRSTYAYDPLYRLLELSQFDAADTLIDQHTYTLGDNGNRLQHAELNGRVVDYTYDDLYRLEIETVTDPTLGDRTAGWTYDAVGNRDTQTESDASGTTTTTYVYDDNDRLVTEVAVGAAPSSTSYVYDQNGNTRMKTVDGIATDYAYDSRNRLISLDNGQVTYRYDATGIRMNETVASLTTNFLVDPNRDYAQVIEESLDPNSFAEVQYTYGDDLIHQHRRIDPSITTTSTFHVDGIGSTRQLTDSAGVVTDTYVFSAFGDLEASSGATVNKFLFTGEQFDPNLGFYYLRARYLNPEIARFQNMDTFSGCMFEPFTLNKYLYANSDPIDFIDPSGFISQIGMLTAGQKVRVVLSQAARNTLRFQLRRVKKNLCRVAGAGVTNAHHAVPVFMGSPRNGNPVNLVNIDKNFHVQFHQLLRYMLRLRGFMSDNAGRTAWEALFKNNVGSRDEALVVLVQAAKIFDKACKLKGQARITPVIKKQIAQGKWDF